MSTKLVSYDIGFVHVSCNSCPCLCEIFAVLILTLDSRMWGNFEL